MALKNMSPEMQAMDKVVHSINHKIQSIAKAFGTDSKQYLQIEEILTGYDAAGRQRNRFSILSVGGTKQKGDVIQISRSRQALADLEIETYKKVVKRLAKLPSAAEQKKRIIRKYEEEQSKIQGKTVKVVGKAAKEALIAGILKTERTLSGRLETALSRLYQLQAEQDGKEFTALTEIRRLSKGRWTETADLEKMVELAEAVAKEEDDRIQGDMYAGY